MKGGDYGFKTRLLPDNSVKATDFEDLGGTASEDGPDLFTLTPDTPDVVGSLDSPSLFDGTKDFSIAYEAYFGTRDAGGGKEIGVFIGGLTVSVHTESTTDIVILYNNQAQAVLVSVDLPNMEDGQWHPIEISWDASAQRFSVSVDGRICIDEVADLVGITGDPAIYFGCYGATTSESNVQRIRFRGFTFTEAS